jgi:Beta-galactosidase
MRQKIVAVLATVLVAGAVTACNPIPSQPNHKALLLGLVDKGSEASYHQGQPYPVIDLSDVTSRAPAVGGVVVNQTWAQLEPEQGTYDFSTLDASLAVVAAYNQAHPSSTLGVRLRVFAAYAAPDWAKTLDGTPITVAATASNTGGTLGRWWESGYRDAWAGLQKALAARYDTNPTLNEVAVSSCTTLTAEPFVMSPGAITGAEADGWTTTDQQSCLDGAFSDYAPWAHTAIYYPMNPLPGDPTVTGEVMNRCDTSASSSGPTLVDWRNDLINATAPTC